MQVSLGHDPVKILAFCPYSVRRRRVYYGFALVTLVLMTPTLWAKGPDKLPALEGVLHSTAPNGPVLEMQGKNQPLSGFTKYIFHTLQDQRLDGRKVRVEGRMMPDGTFQVEWLYTMHEGKLYRVRYFCSVCNIVALEPGKCVCCQRPTELQEIPVEQPEQ